MPTADHPQPHSNMTNTTEESTPVDDIKLDFTGKAIVLLELADYGPVEFSIDDKEIVAELLRVLIEDYAFTVRGAYDESTATQYKTLLDTV
jgi:hypothetical protein